MDFNTIFQEYYTLYRGQANYPKFGTPEFSIAIVLANNAIRKWDRADGAQWRELWTDAQTDGSGDLTVNVGTTEYAAPKNMRKPPAYVIIGGGRYQVINPYAVNSDTNMDGVAYFTGSANSKFVMHLDGDLSQVDGQSIQYSYLKKPTFFKTASDPGRMIPEMSDPNFIVQDMVASRSANNRNGFLYKTSSANATTALSNMKIENDSGTYGNSDNILKHQQYQDTWGVDRGSSNIFR